VENGVLVKVKEDSEHRDPVSIKDHVDLSRPSVLIL
jgi:hypothetical protein